MSNLRVIYKRPEDGGVSVLCPSPNCLKTKTLQEIARKDVPPGVPYKIVDVSDIPTDRTWRDAWDVDENTLTDGTGNLTNTWD